MMEHQTQTSTETDYTFTPEVATAAPHESAVIDLTAIRTESQADDQAAVVMQQNQGGAEMILADSRWEYELLQSNGRDDDANEVSMAANDAAAALQFINLFRESFAEFRQSAEYNRLQVGEQAKWRPSLRDANGRIIGELNYVLLNPIVPQLGHKPVVQIILPNRDYVAEVASRLKPDQHRAAESGHPVSYLERRTKLEDDVTVQTVMTLMTPANADQRGRVGQAMQEYRQAQAATELEDVAGLRQAFGQIVQHTLGVEGFRRDAVIDKMLEVNTLYRVTYHPDINVLGRQPLHLQTVPIDYKGVRLQPPQIRNLLLGNSIEVAGIRDERRPGLYRANVRFNLLSNQLEAGTAREEIKTDHKAEYTQHQQLVHQKGADNVPRPAHPDSQRLTQSSQLEPTPRSAFRLGR